MKNGMPASTLERNVFFVMMYSEIAYWPLALEENTIPTKDYQFPVAAVTNDHKPHCLANTDLSSFSARGRKFKLDQHEGIAKLVFLPEENPCPWLVQLLGATSIHWLMIPFLYFQNSQKMSPSHIKSLKPSFLSLFHSKGFLWLHFTHLDNPGQPPYFKIL